MAPISRTVSLGLIIAKASAFTAPASFNARAIAVTTASSPFLASANRPSNNNNKPTRPPMARRMIGSILDMLGGADSSGLISPEKAMKGRPGKMANIDNHRHVVLGNKIAEVPDGYEVAVFGNGCFWGSEKGVWRMPKGIHSTAVGYCAGFTPNPTYEEACSGQTGHTEGVRVVFDPKEVSFVDILRMFWESHDPTQYMGQGNDRGSQYRSGVYYFDDDQRRLIEASRGAYEQALGGREIKTEVAAATDYDQYGGLWYFAEKYHQQYLATPGARPYCSAQPQGVSLPSFETWAPEDLKEKYAPTLPEAFWAKHAPRKGCSVVNSGNELVSEDSY